MTTTTRAMRQADDRPPPAPACSVATIDVVVDADLWRAEPAAAAAVTQAIAAAAQSTGDEAAEVAVLLTDDSHIRVLNRDFRNFDKPTNVLSFPAAAGAGAPGGPRFLGDIAIAFETAQAEAAAEGKPFAHHLGHLAVHGFLHLVGHDHETDREAEVMEALERRILARLGIPDPYAAGDGEH
jgi:probable rRNA maturation factor